MEPVFEIPDPLYLNATNYSNIGPSFLLDLQLDNDLFRNVLFRLRPRKFFSFLERYTGLDEISDVVVALLAAAIVQLGIFVSYLSFSATRKLFSISNCLIFVLFILLIGFSAYMSTFSILLNSRGDSVDKGFQNKIGVVFNELTTIDRQIVSNFEGQVDAFKSLAEQSRQGLDRSQIAECGSICLDNLEKARLFEEKFGPVLGRLAVINENQGYSDPSENYIVAQSLKTLIDQKIISYSNFCSLNNLPCDT